MGREGGILGVGAVISNRSILQSHELEASKLQKLEAFSSSRRFEKVPPPPPPRCLMSVMVVSCPCQGASGSDWDARLALSHFEISRQKPCSHAMRSLTVSPCVHTGCERLGRKETKPRCGEGDSVAQEPCTLMWQPEQSAEGTAAKASPRQIRFP